jgi:hypothetical protein
MKDILDLGEVKQTINIPTTMTMLVNIANIEKRMVDRFIHEQNLFM